MSQINTLTRARVPGINGPSVRLPGESMAAATRRLGYRPHGRGTDDKRGNKADRQARALKIIGLLPVRRGPQPLIVGDGSTVGCAHGCGTVLTLVTLTIDRIDPDGTYRIDNVVPACGRCNKARGDDPTWRYNPSVHSWGPNSVVG